MPKSNKFLTPDPDDLVVWLYEQDRRPKIVPDWINSKHTALVVLFENRASPGEPAEYEAFIPTDEESFRALVRLRRDRRRRLTFQISREALERTCPGCTAGCG